MIIAMKILVNSTISSRLYSDDHWQDENDDNKNDDNIGSDHRTAEL